MATRKKMIIIILIVLCLAAVVALAIYVHVGKIRERNATEEYKIAKEIMWFCNYTGKNESLTSVSKEVGTHVFGSDESITPTFLRESIRNGKGGSGLGHTGFASEGDKNGIWWCNFEFMMNMDNVTIQKCNFYNIAFYIDEYDSFERVMNYLPIKGLKKDGTIWRGEIKCSDGSKKTIVAKLWDRHYYIYIDLTKRFVESGGAWADGLIE